MFYFLITDFQVYEGNWIREFDGREVNLKLGTNGKLKCKMKHWEHESPNVLNATKGGLYWEHDPGMKGVYHYLDKKIVWQNGLTWKRKGNYIVWRFK